MRDVGEVTERRNKLARVFPLDNPRKKVTKLGRNQIGVFHLAHLSQVNDML